jgi:hypothetical protein
MSNAVAGQRRGDPAGSCGQARTVHERTRNNEKEESPPRPQFGTQNEAAADRALLQLIYAQESVDEALQLPADGYHADVLTDLARRQLQPGNDDQLPS